MVHDLEVGRFEDGDLGTGALVGAGVGVAATEVRGFEVGRFEAHAGAVGAVEVAVPEPGAFEEHAGAAGLPELPPSDPGSFDAESPAARLLRSTGTAPREGEHHRA
ncbi:MAG TPA: hypothetical protein VIL36_16675 [Acidimicrobiales bacterium]